MTKPPIRILVRHQNDTQRLIVKYPSLYKMLREKKLIGTDYPLDRDLVVSYAPDSIK